MRLVLTNPAFLILLLASSVPSAAAGQVIVGTVVTEGGDAITGVEVTLRDSLSNEVARIVSGEAGEFVLVVPAPGTYYLTGARLGFRKTQSRSFEVSSSETVELTLRMTVEAVALDPLNILGRTQNLRQRAFGGFYERLREQPYLDGVRIFSREALDPYQTWTLRQFMRSRAPRVGNPGSSCGPVIYWDGFPLDAPLPNYMSIANIEGIEFYRGFGPSDSRFMNPDYCGVILFWTRRFDP